MSPPGRIAIQVGATAFADEGVECVLDTVQGRAGVNTIFVASPTWSRETGGRAPAGYADHGVNEDDPEWVGGNYATIHPEYYRDSQLGPVGRASEYGDWDVFDNVIPEAKKRGLATYALVDESSSAMELRKYPNFLKCLEVDMWNKPARRPCYNNPDYRNWHLSLIEDYIKSYDLDGLSWRAERSGPLNLLAQGPVRQGLGLISCFCAHCLRKAEDWGIDWKRAQTGFRELVLWNAECARGGRHADGTFVTFWRLLLRFPEILSWQALWTDAQHQLYRDIFGTVRAYKPDMEVGWDLDQNGTFSPFQRASQDFAALSHICDFLKISTYNASGGHALNAWTRNIARAVLGDAAPEDVYPVLLAMLGLDEGPLDQLPDRGLSAGYVRRETERAVETSEGRCFVYAGIDIDVPVGSGSPADRTPVSKSTPHQVRDAVIAAFEGGAHGVVLSRKYAEMRLANLSAVGEAIGQSA